MQIVNIDEAKTHFSELLDDVIHGQEITIAIEGKPVAILRPIRKKATRPFGILKGKVKIAKDFDTPLPEEVPNSFFITP